MRGVPCLSNIQFCSSIGAYEIEETSDPQLFLTAPIEPYSCHLATPSTVPPLPVFLVDSVMTQNLSSENYAKKTGLNCYAMVTHRTIYKFNSSQSTAGLEINLKFNDNPNPAAFIITRLKDA